MRVLFLQQQPCIRALKYAAGLRAALPGNRARLRLPGPDADRAGTARATSSSTAGGTSAASRGKRSPAVVEEFRPDLIHCHNLPGRPDRRSRSSSSPGRVPVVHDVHDLQSLRQTPYEDGFPEPRDPLELERRAIEGCAALVDGLGGAARRRSAPATGSTAPALVFPNYALGRDLPPVLPPAERRMSHPPRLVYQGTLSTNGGHYDLREIFRSLVGEGVSLDVYP